MMLVVFPVQKRKVRVMERWKKMVRGALIIEKESRNLILSLNDVMMYNCI